MRCNSLREISRFLANYRSLRAAGYDRRAAWYWAGRCLPLH